MTAAAASLELNFTALTSTAATVDLALESNAGITLNTGGGDDVITMSISSVGDTISTGAGADGITTAIAQLTASDTVDGGAGTDTLTFSDNGSSADNDFTNVTNIEALALAAGANTIVLGAEYNGSGSVTVTGASGDDSITMGSGVTAAQTIALDTGGDDTFVATGATGAMTVTMQTNDLTAADTLTGGSGTDILQLQYATNVVTTGEMVGVTGFETIKVADNTASWSLALHDNNTVSGVITVDGALATSQAIIFDGTAENDGTVTVTGGGGGDTLTGTATTATGDTISGGAGADTITGLQGGDTITGGTGADVFTYTAVAHSTGTAKDSITDYTSGTDFLTFTINNSTNTSGQTYDATIQTAAAGTAALQAGMSGSIGQTFFDTTNNVLVVNANADNLVTTLDYQVGLNAAATAASTVAAGDVRFVITGGTGADTIVTGGGTDTINAGAGADTVTGGAGVDTINVGANDNAADIVVYNLFSTNGHDVIDDFETTVDHLDLDNVMTGITNIAAKEAIASTADIASYADNEVYVYADGDTASAGAGTATITTYTDLTEVADFLSESLQDAETAGGTAGAFDVTAGDENVFVINDLGNNLTFVYHMQAVGAGDASAGAAIVAAELTILSTITEDGAGALVIADIL
jgi:Ca2+-binding RTX toxin-like protein